MAVMSHTSLTGLALLFLISLTNTPHQAIASRHLKQVPTTQPAVSAGAARTGAAVRRPPIQPGPAATEQVGQPGLDGDEVIWPLTDCNTYTNEGREVGCAQNQVLACCDAYGCTSKEDGALGVCTQDLQTGCCGKPPPPPAAQTAVWHPPPAQAAVWYPPPPANPYVAGTYEQGEAAEGEAAWEGRRLVTVTKKALQRSSQVNADVFTCPTGYATCRSHHFARRPTRTKAGIP